MAKRTDHRFRVQATLNGMGLDKAWEVYEAETHSGRDEETTVRDIVGRFVRWGSISEAQERYLAKLVDRITKRPQIEAQRAADHEAAAPFPAAGRATVAGKVLSAKLKDTVYGPVIKMLVQHATGWKAYGNASQALYEAKPGDEVEFVATLKPSDQDNKFGFWSRPTKARYLKKHLHLGPDTGKGNDHDDHDQNANPQ